MKQNPIRNLSFTPYIASIGLVFCAAVAALEYYFPAVEPSCPSDKPLEYAQQKYKWLRDDHQYIKDFYDPSEMTEYVSDIERCLLESNQTVQSLSPLETPESIMARLNKARHMELSY